MRQLDPKEDRAKASAEESNPEPRLLAAKKLVAMDNLPRIGKRLANVVTGNSQLMFK